MDQFLGLDWTRQTKWSGIIITKNGVADSSIQTHLSGYIHANRTWVHTCPGVPPSPGPRSKLQRASFSKQDMAFRGLGQMVIRR